MGTWTLDGVAEVMMQIKTLHLSFGGSLHLAQPTATTSRFSCGNEKRGEKHGAEGTADKVGRWCKLQEDAGSSISLAKPPSSHHSPAVSPEVAMKTQQCWHSQ